MPTEKKFGFRTLACTPTCWKSCWGLPEIQETSRILTKLHRLLCMSQGGSGHFQKLVSHHFLSKPKNGATKTPVLHSCSCWWQIMPLLILCWMIIYCANIQVVFLPPNITPVLKPMDEGVIATFMRYYLRRTFRLWRLHDERLE